MFGGGSKEPAKSETKQTEPAPQQQQQQQQQSSSGDSFGLDQPSTGGGDMFRYLKIFY